MYVNVYICILICICNIYTYVFVYIYTYICNFLNTYDAFSFEHPKGDCMFFGWTECRADEHLGTRVGTGVCAVFISARICEFLSDF